MATESLKPEEKLDPADEYRRELERTKSQLLLFARDVGEIYQRERRQSQQLAKMMDELQNTYLSTVQTLAFVVEAKDEYTRYHLERCKDYGMALTEAVDRTIVTKELQYGFLLHDVGKIGVPEGILSKPGPLTSEEMRVMRTHPLIGVQVVSPMRFLDDQALAVIRHHHERFDGNGYPDGLEKEKIPLAARIFSVVDAFDAMTTDRPYRPSLSFPEAIRRLKAGAGTQFDPDIVTSFTNLMTTSGAQLS
jgi:HD-GYP domain-containing protein (c-di-GMP phosphodiesterase class II)